MGFMTFVIIFTYKVVSHVVVYNITQQLQQPALVLCFVGSCLSTEVFIGNLQATGRGWIIILKVDQ